ncbi:eng2, partial [Symbiodinium microadriaticum]
MSHTMSPSALWGVVTKPFPTGAFWTNLVVENGDGAVNTIPYGVKCLETGIHVSYGPTRRSVTNKWIRDTFDTDIQISTVEPYQSRSISAHDDLSVTMTFLAASGSYDAVLVKGSPFLTVSFGGCTPLLQSATMHVTSFESHPLPDDSKRRYYVITLGNYQKWLVYTSFDTLLNWKSGDDKVTAAAKVTGVIRMALLPQLDYTPDLNTLLQYASCYPTGASVVLAHPKSMMSTVTYRFRTEGSGGLLMLALPHHVDVLDMSMRDSGASRAAQKTLKHIWTMKGKVLPVVGKEWLLKYDDLKDAQWVFDLEGRVISTDRLNTIAASLQTDVYSSPPSARDPYTFGKEAARMSSLALIADNLGIADARKTALNSLETSMTPWLTGANPDELVYDTTWGGIVPTRGMQDKLADYGAGWYNDHHFHFGYFIYAGAVLAKLDWAYFATHRYLFDALVADICNERGSSTSAYPFARHKDFFDGHSWASGLFQQANGKSQESSSEDSSLVKFSRLLMAMEVRSARKYWHAPDSYVYDEVVAQSSRMI